ncbi:TetR family transcriptional regulator [Conexibacter sp. W3-3-2]|uniref:TetR/AcrR family transcriptional regulator n=1 Tax=Conexibacter sp. W3-3-2 TaxID=2675227 RepID=UPI0012B9D8C3|nr:TetR/AcrR family transcriptional regulator [Conexibacter sp. W3-3-2]MTD43240.1 TetR family transcriptional regulator [Conexibacter sp. W3-3-2]
MAVLSRRAQVAGARRATEDALLEATLSLLAEGLPFAELSIDQIVKRAGLSRPTFYSYFRDKRALVLRLGVEFEEDLAKVAVPWLESADGDVRDTLEGVLAVFQKHATTLSAVVEAATYDPDVAEFWGAFHARFRPGGEARVRAGNPDLDEESVRARAYTLIYMTESSITTQVLRPAVDADALITQLAFMWDAATGG